MYDSHVSHVSNLDSNEQIENGDENEWHEVASEKDNDERERLVQLGAVPVGVAGNEVIAADLEHREAVDEDPRCEYRQWNYPYDADDEHGCT